MGIICNLPHIKPTICSFHQLSPYIGKLNPEITSQIILNYTKPNDTIFDPFAGSGTVTLEALLHNRNVIANDVNPYAVTLIKAKINPPESLEEALGRATFYLRRSKNEMSQIPLADVPNWVRNFFHPTTLQEIVALTKLLRENREDFILACLMGILHHQRPGFLSYPSSHVVPYLRDKNFPREEFPQLYAYRDVESRLLSKIRRSFRNVPQINPELLRECKMEDAEKLVLPKNSIDAVITSPPYMNALDYGRDNRLRLWFLGVNDYRCYDKKSPSTLEQFSRLMSKVLKNLYISLKPGSYCVFIVGDVRKNGESINTASIINKIVLDGGDFYIEDVIEDEIPYKNRARKEGNMTKKEWRIILRKGT